jgi:hypothetical protein
MPDYQELVTREVTVFYVDYRDLDRFIQATYGVPYSFIDTEAVPRPSVTNFEVTGTITDWGATLIDEWLRGKTRVVHTRILLNELAARSLIRKGSYVVEVDER